MKLKIRRSVLCLLFVTVVSPILLYTDRLATFSSTFPRDDFVEEDISTFARREDTGQLNLLPQDTGTALKEPVGIIYSENSAYTTSTSDASFGEDSRKIRQLTQESVEHRSRVLSTTTNNADQVEPKKPTRHFTEGMQQVVGTGKMQINIENDNKPLISGKGSHNTSDNMEMKRTPQSGQNPGKIGVKADVDIKAKAEETNNRASLPNVRVRYLKDQLIRAKVYLSLTATRNNAHFVRELKQRMKEVQRALADATRDSELPRNAYEKLKAMDQTLARGKQTQDDCTAMVKKLRAILHSTEEQLRVHRKQTLFLTQLTAKTLPKGLHCLPLRLSAEYYTLNFSQQQFPYQEKLDNPQLYHYAIFSDNILAAAVVVNSTVSHAKDPSRHVFHIVTDRLNYAAMRMWFLVNPPSKAAIQVQNVEEFTWLNSSYSPVLKQLGSPSMIDYYFRVHRALSDSNLKFRNPKYLSILNHLRFYLPEIFPKLKKVVFLDDDIVVQKDLSGLWSIDLNGNVNGAVETCGESFHRFDRYLNFSNPLISKKFHPHACGWAYGMNIFDLEEWKRQNITQVYHKWQNLNHDRQLWKLGTLPPGLITFWKRTYPLHRSWHVLGLGYNPNVNQKDIERAAVIHYNGNMKPWLEIGMPKYRSYWTKYIDYDQVYLQECNINP